MGSPGAAKIDPSLVTVVIPSWNRAALLVEAIASVVAQSYGNWEIVVADDGSTDDTVERLETLALPRLRIVRLEHSGNLSRVRNAGAAAGTGALIAFLDSDDLWLPFKLERQIGALRTGTARWCYSDFAHVDESGARIPFRAGKVRPMGGRILPALLSEQTGAFIGTLVVERGLYEELGGFDEGLRLRGDLDLTLRLAAAADAVAVPEVLTLVREHRGRTTGGARYPHELTARVYARFLDRESDPGLRALGRARRARLLAEAGVHRLGLGERWSGLRLLVEAVAGGAGLRPVAALMIRRRGAGTRRR